jgi:hypothetical protein
LSYPALPAFCQACKSYSHAQRSSGGVGIVVAAFAITGSGIAASAVRAMWPFLVGIVGSLAFYLWHFHSIQLEPLLSEQVSNARKTEGMNAVALLVAFFMS